MADKFDKFTERARKVLTLANEEAQRFNHNYIGTEHILLGLVREGDGVAARVLSNLGIELPKVRNEITETKPENVSLTIVGEGGACGVYWGMKKVTSEELLDRAVKALEDQIAKVGGVENINEENMPEVHIRGDINTPYKCIGGAVFTMQRAGFARVGFISQPPPSGAAQ